MKIIEEKNKKPQTVTIGFRTSPTYKNYLENWSKSCGWSVSELLNNWLRRAIHSDISDRARKHAHEITAPLFDVNPKMAITIESRNDWKKLRELLGDEKYEAYNKKWWEVMNDKADEIADSEGFVWNYDTPTGLIADNEN